MHVQQSIAQRVVRQLENVLLVKMDIIFQMMECNACHVSIRFQIANSVLQQQNVQHVMTISIQQMVEPNAKHVNRNIVQNVTQRQENVVHAHQDIMSIQRQNNVRSVQTKWQTVDCVQVEMNVTPVETDIIPMEVDVHCAQTNIVQHVMHQPENVQLVSQNIIWTIKNVSYVLMR